MDTNKENTKNARVSQESEHKHHPKYNLFTAIALIVGIVIGSGIFFKADDILYYTGGNVFIGIIVFLIAAISIIFGSLSVAQLSKRSSGIGGIVDYSEKFISKKLACAVGWFQMFLYFPTLLVVVSWVAGIYATLLFGLPNNLFLQILIGFLFNSFLFVQNYLAPKIGGYFQNTAMIIKLIPLFVIAIIGIVFGNPQIATIKDITANMGSSVWIAAIIPIAFSFDGWMIATTVAHDIKNSKKNLTRALIISPIAILILYVLYFVGVSSLLDVNEIVLLGNEHIDVIANNLFGPFGAKIILTFIVISVLGTMNGLVIAIIRLPYTLARKGYFPMKKLFYKENKQGMSTYSVVFTFLLMIAWYIVHIIIESNNLLQNSDISEIAIVFNYIFFIFLYYAVTKLYRKKELGVVAGLINPILATIGSIIIIIGGFFNPLMIYFTIICLIVVVTSLIWFRNVDIKSQ